MFPKITKQNETHPLATSWASPGTLEALEDVSTDSATNLCVKLNPALFWVDLSFCARFATAEALRGVLNVLPITSVLLSVFEAAALVVASSEKQNDGYFLLQTATLAWLIKLRYMLFKLEKDI